MVKKNFGVITVDLKESRKLRNRAIVQSRVRTLIRRLNREFGKDLQAGFVITRGDEFQGALVSLGKTYQIFKKIRYHLGAGGVEFRCGVGFGEISTSLSKNVLEMDGPAFHRSRDALEKAKREKTEVVINSGDERKDRTLNALVRLVLCLMKKWTDRQIQVIEYLETHPNAKHIDVAKHARTSKQAISNIVRRTNYRDIIEAEQAIDELLVGVR